MPDVVVCVEGTPGCGKSTALRARDPYRGVWPVCVIRERRHAGGREEGVPGGHDGLAASLVELLEFPDPRGDDTPLANGNPARPPALWIVEGSPASCRHVSAQLRYNDGRMSAEEWNVFKEYFDVLGWVPDAVVHVDVPAEECARRLGTADVTRLRRAEFQHETMLRFSDVPTRRVDGTGAPEAVAAAVSAAVAAVAASFTPNSGQPARA